MKLSAFCGVLISAILFSATLEAKTLSFNENGKFKIVQFTDTHVIYGDERSNVAIERMYEIIEAEKPDLVIFTGDVIFGKPAKESLLWALEPVVKTGVPFAVTWGNHDDENGLSRRELLDLIKDIPNNMTGTTEGITGVTNYILPVMSKDDSEKEKFVLYIFDSNSYSRYKEVKGYSWIGHDQIGWYKNNSRRYTEANGGNPLPSLAFFHIPIPEFSDALRNERAFCYGIRKEKVACPKINSGLGTAMVECRDIMGVFVGHDHVNDFATEWQRIMLCYGRYTGGSTVYHDVLGGNGARVIEITEGERGFRTWIRIKDGKVMNEFNYPTDLRD